MPKKLVFIFVSLFILFIAFNVYVYLDYQKLKKSVKDLEVVLVNKKDPIVTGKSEPFQDNSHTDGIWDESTQTLKSDISNKSNIDKGEPSGDTTIPDTLSEAQKRLQYIKENPHEWGSTSRRAAALIDMLMPVIEFHNEAQLEDTVSLLDELATLEDPRSAEVFVNYLFYSHWGREQTEAVIKIGVPAIPHLVACLDLNADLAAKLMGTRLLGTITAQHRKELGAISEVIIIPGLKQLAVSDKEPTVRGHAIDALLKIQN